MTEYTILSILHICCIHILYYAVKLPRVFVFILFKSSSMLATDGPTKRPLEKMTKVDWISHGRHNILKSGTQVSKVLYPVATCIGQKKTGPHLQSCRRAAERRFL